MKLLDTIAEIATKAIARKGISPVCGRIVWLHNDDMNEDVPALCMVPSGVEHLHSIFDKDH